MTVWLASYPRAGNTLARLVLYHVFGLASRSLYNDSEITRGLLGPSASRVSEHELSQLDDQSAAPLLVKSHELPSDARPAIYVVRDGRDTLISYAHFIQALEPDDPTFSSWLKGPEGLESLLLWLATSGHPQWGTWSEHALAWIDRPEGSTAIVRYEQLVADPVGTMRRALDRLNLAASPGSGRVPGFQELHALAPQFFRAGREGAWQAQMPDFVHRAFWSVQADGMARLGYEGQPNDDVPFPAYAIDILRSSGAAFRAIDEKEVVIQQQVKAASEREEVIQQQAVLIAEKERSIQNLAETSVRQAAQLQSTLSLLRTYEAELALKESVIGYLLRFRTTSLRYWLVTKPHLLALRLTGRAPSRAQEEESRERVTREVESELASENSPTAATTSGVDGTQSQGDGQGRSRRSPAKVDAWR